QNQYNYFVGGLAQRLEQWHESNPKKNPSDKELMEIVNPLIRDTGEMKSWTNWFGKGRLFFEPPSEFKTEWGAKFRQKYGYDTSNQQMGTMWKRELDRRAREQGNR